MTISEIFEKAENGVLSWEQFQAASGEAKFVDLSEGNYVSKQKYTDELGQRDTRINDLTNTITSRDADLSALKATLKDAGDLDALKRASKDLESLQKKYTTETQEYQAKLNRQAYEFAVKEFANGKNFSSNAAKRDFVHALLEKNLTLENGKIIGAEDFTQVYAAENADAFVVEAKPQEQEPPKPQFVNPTPGGAPLPKENAFAEAFKFTGVRPHE